MGIALATGTPSGKGGAEGLTFEENASFDKEGDAFFHIDNIFEYNVD